MLKKVFFIILIMSTFILGCYTTYSYNYDSSSVIVYSNISKNDSYQLKQNSTYTVGAADVTISTGEEDSQETNVNTGTKIVLYLFIIVCLFLCVEGVVAFIRNARKRRDDSRL